MLLETVVRQFAILIFASTLGTGPILLNTPAATETKMKMLYPDGSKQEIVGQTVPQEIQAQQQAAQAALKKLEYISAAVVILGT